MIVARLARETGARRPQASPRRPIAAHATSNGRYAQLCTAPKASAPQAMTATTRAWIMCVGSERGRLPAVGKAPEEEPPRRRMFEERQNQVAMAIETGGAANDRHDAVSLRQLE